MPNIFNQFCGHRVLDISLKSNSLKIQLSVDKFEKIFQDLEIIGLCQIVALNLQNI